MATSISSNNAMVHDKETAEVSAATFLTADHEPKAASFCWAVVIGEGSLVKLQAQSFSAAATLFSGKHQFTGKRVRQEGTDIPGKGDYTAENKPFEEKIGWKKGNVRGVEPCPAASVLDPEPKVTFKFSWNQI